MSDQRADPVFGGGVFGANAYTIKWQGPTGIGMAVVNSVPGHSDLKSSLDADGLQNQIVNKDLEEGQVQIQGRRISTLRFKDLNGLIHLRVDITGDKAPYATLELMAKEEDAGGLEKAAIKFLQPFDIWRG